MQEFPWSLHMHEAGHFPPSSAEFENAWSFISLICLHGIDKDSFTLLYYRRTNIMVFWRGSHCFGKPCCIHLQDRQDVTEPWRWRRQVCSEIWCFINKTAWHHILADSSPHSSCHENKNLDQRSQIFDGSIKFVTYTFNCMAETLHVHEKESSEGEKVP